MRLFLGVIVFQNLLIKKVRCQSERLGDFVKYQPGKYCGEIYEFEVKQYV